MARRPQQAARPQHRRAATRRAHARSWFEPGNRLAVHTVRLLLTAFVLGLWQFGADRLFDSFFFSTPLRIIRQVGLELADPAFYADLGVTAFEMIVGFVVGAGLGIALGVLLARWAFMAKVLDPLLLRSTAFHASRWRRC